MGRTAGPYRENLPGNWVLDRVCRICTSYRETWLDLVRRSTRQTCQKNKPSVNLLSTYNANDIERIDAYTSQWEEERSTISRRAMTMSNGRPGPNLHESLWKSSRAAWPVVSEHRVGRATFQRNRSG